MARIDKTCSGEWRTMPMVGILPPPLSKSPNRGIHPIYPRSRIDDLERRVRKLEMDRTLLDIVESYNANH